MFLAQVLTSREGSWAILAIRQARELAGLEHLRLVATLFGPVLLEVRPAAGLRSLPQA